MSWDMLPWSLLSHYRNGMVVQMGWMVGKEFIFIFIISLSTRKASLLIFGWLDGREVTFWMKCPCLHFHFEVLTMFIFLSQVLAQMRSTGDVNPGHYSKTIAQVVTLIFLSRSKKSVFQLIKNPPFEGAWPDSLLPRALHGTPRYPCHCHTGSTGRTDEHGGVC